MLIVNHALKGLVWLSWSGHVTCNININVNGNSDILVDPFLEYTVQIVDLHIFHE